MPARRPRPAVEYRRFPDPTRENPGRDVVMCMNAQKPGPSSPIPIAPPLRHLCLIDGAHRPPTTMTQRPERTHDMTRTFILAAAASAAAALSLTAPAVAQDGLSLAERAALQSALSSDDHIQARAIRQGATGIGSTVALSSKNDPSAIARAEAAALRSARSSDDHKQAAFIEDGGLRQGARTSAATAAPSDNAALAAVAGVEPGVYSTAELSALIAARNDDDHTRVRFILNGGLRD
jgi:hypothetical protein